MVATGGRKLLCSLKERVRAAAGLRSWPTRNLPRAQTYYGYEHITGIIRNMVPVNQGFHTHE